MIIDLYIKKDVLRNYNLKKIRDIFYQKIEEYGTLFGEFEPKKDAKETSLSRVSHINRNIYYKKIDIEIINTFRGQMIDDFIDNDIELYGLIRDNGDINNYIFYTVDISTEIPDNYVKIIDRREKLERILN